MGIIIDILYMIEIKDMEITQAGGLPPNYLTNLVVNSQVGESFL